MGRINSHGLALSYGCACFTSWGQYDYIFLNTLFFPSWPILNGVRIYLSCLDAVDFLHWLLELELKIVFQLHKILLNWTYRHRHFLWSYAVDSKRVFMQISHIYYNYLIAWAYFNVSRFIYRYWFHTRNTFRMWQGQKLQNALHFVAFCCFIGQQSINWTKQLKDFSYLTASQKLRRVDSAKFESSSLMMAKF